MVAADDVPDAAANHRRADQRHEHGFHVHAVVVQAVRRLRRHARGVQQPPPDKPQQAHPQPTIRFRGGLGQKECSRHSYRLRSLHRCGTEHGSATRVGAKHGFVIRGVTRGDASGGGPGSIAFRRRQP